jgi:hypothetical protein
VLTVGACVSLLELDRGRFRGSGGPTSKVPMRDGSVGRSACDGQLLPARLDNDESDIHSAGVLPLV